MSIFKIDGEMYHRMLFGASLALENKKDEINSLNVFPVPDGDTGTNMSLTIDAVRSASRPASKNLAESSETSARDMMRAARGNSGVILSLFFRGVAKKFAGHAEADVNLITEAFRAGAEEARKAVMKPVEGTILTVMRECCSAAPLSEDVLELFNTFHTDANEILKKTPDMLPALKRARVVDSGGYGFTIALDGMLRVLKGDTIELDIPAHASAPSTHVFSADFGEYNPEDIAFAFCTECLASKNPGVTDAKLERLRSYLAGVGDSIVMICDEEIIKIHVHTNEPLAVLARITKLGEIQFSKIENMRSQHEKLVPQNHEHAPAAPMKKYAIIAVANGAGLGGVFRELGVDYVVAGGQSMNPSADDFLKALKDLSCEHAIILPNNPNIVLTAEQAAKLAEGVNVEVVKSVTIPQGISAMIAFDEELEPAENLANMTEAMAGVTSLSVTNAIKGMDGEKLKVKKNQIIGLVNNELRYAADSIEDCLAAFSHEIADKEIITLYYGKGISETEARHAADVLENSLGPDHDIMIIPGEQPIYTYLISAE